MFSTLLNPFLDQTLVFTCLQGKSFENTVGKGETACNKQFLLFPVFSTCLKSFLLFSTKMKLSSATSFNSDLWERVKTKSEISVTFVLSSTCALNLDQSKTLSFGRVKTSYCLVNYSPLGWQKQGTVRKEFNLMRSETAPQLSVILQKTMLCLIHFITSHKPIDLHSFLRNLSYLLHCYCF